MLLPRAQVLVLARESRPFVLDAPHVDCPHWHGSGRSGARMCAYCRGAGEVTEDDERVYLAIARRAT